MTTTALLHLTNEQRSGGPTAVVKNALQREPIKNLAAVHLTASFLRVVFLILTDGRTNSEHARILRHGPASWSRESGNPERGGLEAAPAQPRAPQPWGRAGMLRPGLPRLPPGVQ